MLSMGDSPKWYGKGHRKLTCSSAGCWSWRVLLGLHLRCQSSLPAFSCFFSHLPSFTSGVYPESTSWPSVSGCHICTIVKLYSLHGWSLWHDRALAFLFKVNLGVSTTKERNLVKSKDIKVFVGWKIVIAFSFAYMGFYYLSPLLIQLHGNFNIKKNHCSD